MIPNTPMTLALDTTSGGFAFAVLQGSETLLDWACSEVSKKKPKAWRRRIEKLLARYAPDLLVLPDVEDSRRGKWAKRFTQDIESLAIEKGIAVRRVSRREVQEQFKVSGTTKYEIAVASHPPLPGACVPAAAQRKPWMSEDKRMRIFDALSFAVTAAAQDS